MQAEKPMTPIPNTSAAASHAPRPIVASAAVAMTLMQVATRRKRLRAPPASANAPSAGAINAMSRLASELVRPRRNEVSEASAPAPQYSLNRIGAKPAITVVLNAELAQSYMDQAFMARSFAA